MPNTQIIFKGELSPVDIEKRCCGGFAYVCKKGDKVVVDHCGDTWDIAEVEKTAHQFVKDCRVGGESHITKGGAELVESMIFSRAVQDTLGIDIKKDGESIEGWFVVFSITDDALLEKVKKGILPMFSIGGMGKREVIE